MVSKFEPAQRPRVGIRWTIGDVSERGFQSLRLSIMGALSLFGSAASYSVCLNSVPLELAKARVGPFGSLVAWHVADDQIPPFLQERLDSTKAEGVGWKFAPLRVFPDRYEIALDNDCILWNVPSAIEKWFSETERCLLAEDTAACFGWFAPLCGPEPRNTGIRGLPPGFDLEAAIKDVLLRLPDVSIAGEVDEQGLQVAAQSSKYTPLTVTTEDVAICSPLPLHKRTLGECGAHFVGLNLRHPRPEYGCDQAMLDRIAAHWDANLPLVEARLTIRSAI